MATTADISRKTFIQSSCIALKGGWEIMTVESSDIVCKVMCDVSRKVRYFLTERITFFPKLIGASIDSKLSSRNSIAD